MRLNKYSFFVALAVLLLASCISESITSDKVNENSDYAIRFSLKENFYEGLGISRNMGTESGVYDKLFFYVADEQGDIVKNIRASYNAATSEIYAEGLHEGDYKLLVLGIRGDEAKDNAQIHDIINASETWLEFPSDLGKPLEAEYFYSKTPFTVQKTIGEKGDNEITSIEKNIYQKRIVGRMDINFIYNNRYVSNSIKERKLQLSDTYFYTSLTGEGHFSGKSDGIMHEINMNERSSFLFMPTIERTSINASITHITQNYRGEKAVLNFDFLQKEILPNNIHDVRTEVNHPDDQSAVMFITEKAYGQGEHSLILTDDEHKDIYTDRALRSFNTAEPLQLSITDDGKFHARFYSPRILRNAIVKAKIPAVSDEFFDFAFFDSIPAFGDFYEATPVMQHRTMGVTESGKLIEIPKLTASDLSSIVFKVESTDPYWQKIREIKHGWTIYWSLYGGDPEKEDGGPVGNWMGIRPVHCRESVAFFLNFTYLIDMEDHERILRENAHKLYDDNKQLVKVEDVLKQMRRPRSLQVGLVYNGNNVAGLGGGNVYGVYQPAWFNHYTNTLMCNFMFHELGHVMGYGHNSSFTYGPWAEELMNRFYVDNLYRMPIDSPKYLNSASNPNRYR